jgi:hypothetical protein
MRNLRMFLSLTIAGLLFSCGYSKKDFELNEKERAFFRPFTKGDTII